MAIMGFNLVEVRNFVEQVDKLRSKIVSDEGYRNRVLSQGDDYFRIKKFFQEFTGFLRYKESLKIRSLYRVRKSCGDSPFYLKKDVLYPEPNINHEDRMNNSSFRVLYVSFHEFTAMAETRLDQSFVGSNFQLTRFSTGKEISVFRLGMFSELHLNTPRDSEFSKNKMRELFGSEYHDRTVQGYAALECAVADVLYDKNDGYHILSSIMADAIFGEITEVDAIVYPSMQNRYGTNVAIKKDFADTLNIEFTSFNRLDDVFENGFFKYTTLKECSDCSNPDFFTFSDVVRQCCYR